MKMSQLAYITREQLSGIATLLANTKVPGLKITTKKFLQAVAETEEVKPDALNAKLEKLHQEAYQFVEQEAQFLRLENGDVNLVKVSANLNVTGFGKRTIAIYHASLNFDKVCLTPSVMPRLPQFDGDREAPSNVRMRNLQLATNAAFEHCMFINNSIDTITPEQLVKMGYAVNIKSIKPLDKISEAKTDLHDTDYERQYGNFLIAIGYAGEGFDGDYNSEDPADRPLLRYSIQELDGDEYYPVENACYCTLLSTDTPEHLVYQAMDFIAKKALPLIPENKHKRVCEQLSWLELRGGMQLVWFNDKPLTPEMEIIEPETHCAYCSKSVDTGEVCADCAEKYNNDVFDVPEGCELGNRD